MFCHVLALTGFLLLRRDRPDWPRPIKVSRAWVPIAAVLALFNLILVLDGVIDQKVASYIGFYEFKGLPLFLGVGVLVAAVLLYFYRRAVQDKSQDHVPRPRRADDAERRSRWRCSTKRRSPARATSDAASGGGGSGRPRPGVGS